MWLNKIKIFHIGLFVVLQTSCNFEKKDPPAAQPLATGEEVGDNSSDDGSAGSLNVEDLNNLVLSVDNPLAKSYYLHQSGQANSNTTCTLAKSTLAAATDTIDIHCFLEGEELDLWENGVNFKFNVPPGLCEYVTYSPFSFWNFPVGQTFYSETVNEVAPECVTCTGQPGSTCPASNADDEPYFRFDYTNPYNSAPNCDMGLIVRTSVTWAVADAENFPGVCTSTASDPQEIEAGGNFADCVGGPGKDFLLDAQGMPVDVIYNGAKNGFNEEFKIAAPQDKNLSNLNYYLTNYTKVCSQPLSTRLTEDYKYQSRYIVEYGYDSSTNRLETYADYTNESSWRVLDPFKFAYANSGARAFVPNPFYEWSCLNKAREVKARFRVSIRDWNKTFNYADTSAEINKINPTNLDILGAETETTDGGSVGRLNDIRDWDDLIIGMSAYLAIEQILDQDDYDDIQAIEDAVDCTDLDAQIFNFPSVIFVDGGSSEQ